MKQSAGVPWKAELRWDIRKTFKNFFKDRVIKHCNGLPMGVANFHP